MNSEFCGGSLPGTLSRYYGTFPLYVKLEGIPRDAGVTQHPGGEQERVEYGLLRVHTKRKPQRTVSFDVSPVVYSSMSKRGSARFPGKTCL